MAEEQQQAPEVQQEPEAVEEKSEHRLKGTVKWFNATKVRGVPQEQRAKTGQMLDLHPTQTVLWVLWVRNGFCAH